MRKSCLLPLLLCGCANLGMNLPGSSTATPYGQLQNVRVTSEGLDPKTRAFTLELSAEFRVDNPTARAVTVSAHEATLVARATGGQKAETEVARIDVPATTIPAGKFAVIAYVFDLDLARDELAALAGTEAEYGIRAEADLDLPAALRGTLEQQIRAALGGSGTDPSMTAAIRQAAALASQDVQANLPVGVRDGRLRLGHDGTIRLPKAPEIRLDGNRGRLQLLGPNEVVDLSGPIQAIRAPSQQFLQFMDGALGAALDVFPGLNLGSVLQTRLGLPSALTDAMLLVANLGQGRSSGQLGFAERTAARTLLGAVGVSVPGRPTGQALSAQTAIELPSVSLVDLMGRIDAESPDKYRALKDGLTRLLNDPTFNGTTFVPTGLPDGVQVRIPFVLRNPNTFPIRVPANRLQLASGVKGVASVRTGPASSESAEAVIPAESEVAMEYSAEIRWDGISRSFVQLAQSGDLSGLDMELDGALSVDVGYGLTPLPLGRPTAKVSPARERALQR